MIMSMVFMYGWGNRMGSLACVLSDISFFLFNGAMTMPLDERAARSRRR